MTIQERSKLTDQTVTLVEAQRHAANLLLPLCTVPWLAQVQSRILYRAGDCLFRPVHSRHLEEEKGPDKVSYIPAKAATQENGRERQGTKKLLFCVKLIDSSILYTYNTAPHSTIFYFLCLVLPVDPIRLIPGCARLNPPAPPSSCAQSPLDRPSQLVRCLRIPPSPTPISSRKLGHFDGDGVGACCQQGNISLAALTDLHWLCLFSLYFLIRIFLLSLPLLPQEDRGFLGVRWVPHRGSSNTKVV